MAAADVTADVCVRTKRCSTCKSDHPLSLFHKSKSGTLGVAGRCKACAVQAARDWHHSNRERANATSAAFRSANPCHNKAYMGAYYERHKDRIKKRVRARETALVELLRPANAAKTARYNASKVRATPAWADQKEILAFYELAAKLAAETGVPHNVDHVVPLQSRLVCGLHTPANLQVLPKAVNQSKSNRWWPDMP